MVNTPAAENKDNTGIYLYNAILKSSNSPILVKNAKKTILHLVKGTSNVVEDGKGDHLFVTVNGKQDTAKAAIYSKDDMNIKGAGKLTVTSNFKNGIQSSNDLKIKNGDITVVAEDNGIKSKGSLEVSGGTLNITAKAGDGLESDECEKDALDSCINIIEGKGIVNISGGAITIVTATEGIEAYKIFAEGGVTSTFATDDGWNGAGGPKDGNATGMLSMLSESGGYIVISGGYHYISAKGNMIDVLDANDTATMTGGVLILEITGESYEAGMGMGSGGCSTNIPGVDVPGCDTVSYTSDNYYGSENAAFKPTYKGSTILYGGEVKSVGLVETSGMKEFKFPNGVSYMYK